MKRRLPEPARRLHFVVPGPIDQATGGYRYAARIVAGLRKAGWSVTVHELDGRFPYADRTAVQAAKKAVQAAKRDEPMVIDGLALPAFAEIVEDATRKVTCVALIHHPLALETGLSVAARAHFATLEPRLVSRIGRAIVTSKATAAQVAAMGLPPDRVAVVEPGLDRPRPVRARHVGRTRLLCVASVTQRKGYLFAIRALRGLRALRWTFEVVGSTTRDAAHAKRVRAAMLAAQLAGRVRFVGEVAPTATGFHYARADLFVLPSEHEGYGMAFAEAMAHGLPVVGARTGAVPDTVPRGAGILVRPRDAAALRRALRLMISSARRRKRAAAIARARARQLANWDLTAARFATAIAHLIASSPSPRASRGGGLGWGVAPQATVSPSSAASPPRQPGRGTPRRSALHPNPPPRAKRAEGGKRAR
jgi:glycosyltransferase involved in cell wall biosynthesis